MPRFYWKKLVRDKIVHYSQIDPKVKDIVYSVLDDGSFHRELIRKADEEAREIPYECDNQEDLAEIADLQAVVDALRVFKGYSEQDVKDAVARKESEKGGFTKRHYVEYVDLADDSEWVEVFRALPDKYIEEQI